MDPAPVRHRTLLALCLAMRALVVPDDLPRLTSVQLTWSDLLPVRPRIPRAPALRPHASARVRTP